MEPAQNRAIFTRKKVQNQNPVLPLKLPASAAIITSAKNSEIIDEPTLSMTLL